MTQQRCRSYRPGHNTHWIQASLASREAGTVPPVPVTLMRRDGFVLDVWLDDGLERWRFHAVEGISGHLDAWQRGAEAALLTHGLLMIGRSVLHPCRDVARWRDCPPPAPLRPRPEADALDPTLQLLVELDVEASGGLEPDLVARVCRHDHRRVLRLIRATEEQVIEWDKAAKEAERQGDPEEAAACAHERQGWERTATDLRRALRYVVEARRFWWLR